MGQESSVRERELRGPRPTHSPPPPSHRPLRPRAWRVACQSPRQLCACLPSSCLLVVGGSPMPALCRCMREDWEKRRRAWPYECYLAGTPHVRIQALVLPLSRPTPTHPRSPTHPYSHHAQLWWSGASIASDLSHTQHSTRGKSRRRQKKRSDACRRCREWHCCCPRPRWRRRGRRRRRDGT